jgi:predicted phosphate transport protein (TIGR00153 family)
MKLKDWLVPREEKFFDLLSALMTHVAAGADALVVFYEKYDDPKAHRNRIKEIEHKGDEATHAIHEALNVSFITPIDREDIAALAASLDDVLDEAYHAAERTILYEVEKPTPPMVELARILAQQAQLLKKCMDVLQDPGKRGALREVLVEIHRLENQADEVTNRALGALFKEQDVKLILKMKELYETLERATDRAEDVADVIRDLIVKYA